jgi:hypothetical protein
MNLSIPVKNMRKYLAVLALLAAIALGFRVGKELYTTAPDSYSETRPIILEAAGPCSASNVYTSLPPKCKTFAGDFVPMPGSPLLVTP